ncbi:MAG: hypothetical protein HY590_03375 [Candidatus Omnitrophica bacterium]|nr:hypothetical protein [Candidatus Omnitrophota bacterium]
MEETMKRMYETPKIFRIRLNHEQAILSQCATNGTSASDSGTNTCRANGCRSWSRTQGNSAISS